MSFVIDERDINKFFELMERNGSENQYITKQ